MSIEATKTFKGRIYHFSGVGHRHKRSAQSYAKDIRRAGHLARVIGSKEIGWFVYVRRGK